MTDSISFSYKTRAWDYALAHVLLQRDHHLRNFALYIVFLVCVFAVTITFRGGIETIGPGLVFLLTGQAPLGLYALFVLALLIGWSAPWWGGLSTALFMRFSPFRGRDNHLTLAKEGIHVSVGDISSDIEWSSIKLLRSDSKLAALKLWTGQVALIPRHAFATDADYTAAVSFAEAHTKKAA